MNQAKISSKALFDERSVGPLTRKFSPLAVPGLASTVSQELRPYSRLPLRAYQH